MKFCLIDYPLELTSSKSLNCIVDQLEDKTMSNQ